MAISVTANLTTLSEAQDATGGTWVGASGTYDTEVKYMDTASWYYQTPKNGIGDANFTPTSSVDMSAADTHLFWWMKCDIFSFCELLNTGATASGLMVKVESSASDYVTWHVAGSDTWGGEWKSFVLDLNNTANTFSVTGTLNLAAVTKVSFLTDNSNSGNIRIVDNTNMNAVRFGTGLTLTGTLFNLVDAAADDELPANKYGVLQNIDGNIHCQGRIIIGSGATTTTYNSTDEEIVFKDAIVSSGLYKFDFVGSGNTSVVEGFVAKGAGTATFIVDASDTAASLTLSGSTFIRAGLVDFASTSDIQSTVFNNCGQIVPSTGTFRFNTISNFVGTTGALLFPSTDANISDLNFLICDNGVEYDATSDSTTPAFTNFTFDDEAGNYDVNNTSGGAVTIGNVGSNSNSYNPAGDIVTFSVDPVTIKLIAQTTSGTKIQDCRSLVIADTVGPYPGNVTITITSVTTTATVSHTAHGLSNGDEVQITGAIENNYNGIQTISNVSTNAYDYTIVATTSPATGTIKASFVFINGLTDVNGEISDTRTYSSDQVLGGRVRKSSGSPYYKTGPIVGTVDSATGVTINVIMLSDE